MTTDPLVSRRYRELARAEPRAGVDDAILHAARSDTERVAARPKPADVRWVAPFSMAAVLVLMVSVVKLAPPSATDIERFSSPERAHSLETATPIERTELLLPPAQATLSPERWLAELERMLAAGQIEDAREGLKAFVLEHPSARVPQTMLDALEP